MPDSCAHLKALKRMHRALYPELHDKRREVYQWHAGTVEEVASILNDALGFDGEGRNAEQQAANAERVRREREAVGRG